jgi:hypothetical protein
MKFLCMCEGGNNRSGALAYILKCAHGVEAIQIGWRWNSAETIAMLAGWADFIILMHAWPPEITKIPTSYASKVRVLEVGNDVWGANTHPDLISLLVPIVEEWKSKDWKL